MNKIVALILTLLTISVYSQTDSEKARALCKEAIKEMDSGNIKVALDLLKECESLDPKDINYPYETAFAHYLDENYKESIKILKGLLKHKDLNDRVFQMLGNAYDMDGKPEKAIETYEKGIESFPKSGSLYLERGNMEVMKKDYNAALGYYEKGIEVQPEFPSNYYWAAKIYMISSEEVWGMLYGEIFMNIERNSKRTAEISKLLYDTYKSEITITSDTSGSVSFCQQMVVNLDPSSEPKDFKLPFCMIYEPTLLLSVVLTDSINITSLDKIRAGFVENYYSQGRDKDYPNALFDYQKKVMENGHFEAYNHWVLMKGEEDGFSSWLENNEEKWDNFIAWFSENPMDISESNRFYKRQY